MIVRPMVPRIGIAGGPVYDGKERFYSSSSIGNVLMGPSEQAVSTGSCGIDVSDDTTGTVVGPIRSCVSDALETYFRQLNGHGCSGLYRLVLDEVEAPLFEAVMDHCGGNQTKAAEILGINRGTLRKKLQRYGLDD